MSLISVILPEQTRIQRHCLYGEDEGEVAFFSTKRWDRRNRADLIESAIPCHDVQVVGPFHQTVLAAMSMDYITVPQQLPLYMEPTFLGVSI